MLKEGITGEAETIVSEDNTAIKMGSGTLPVFATPAMVATVEKAAWSSVAGELEEGQSTVGTAMSLSHESATPVGLKITAKTTLTAIDRRKLTFSWEAYDEAGIIGRGTHERFIVDNEKFVSKAERKKS
ncbi:MAG: thioesterase family protein [Lachnospiraceae bacterium]|nr:thioesterase family protein [Lachnospiraceae bacterium]MDD7664471.1 thioesterase family protein [Lachnospiraceae bacterium]MDY4164473.1 thioesterase family protein [Lachnospiraceae bacterium]